MCIRDRESFVSNSKKKKKEEGFEKYYAMNTSFLATGIFFLLHIRVYSVVSRGEHELIGNATYVHYDKLTSTVASNSYSNPALTAHLNKSDCFSISSNAKQEDDSYFGVNSAKMARHEMLNVGLTYKLTADGTHALTRNFSCLLYTSPSPRDQA
eukprot:TRINITY_DN21934_c0_g1_i1.p1 TRINITY_DN21934_c0_g1~~TRINITY_DN21934_c0_g1_i1.p1  ORF type:complete len:166 (+),score=26.29 TRINITY_DN21934_c0_g1_i1:38-499(+)